MRFDIPDLSLFRHVVEAGSITQVESSGRSRTESLETRLTLTYQPSRLSASIGYTLGEGMNDFDGALTLPPDSSNLLAEWGPSRGDIRHRFQASINTNLRAGFRMDANFRARFLVRAGELYEGKGDTQGALRRYQEFLELWRNADPEYQPRVREIRERVGRLQRQVG